MGGTLVRILLLPFKLLYWPIRMLRQIIGKNTGKAIRKSSGSLVASTQDDHFSEIKRPAENGEAVETRPAGLESLLFRQLERPRLIERAAADMTLEEAQFEVDHAVRFYTYNFSMFPSGDFFYEEVEQNFLEKALGLENKSTDARFIRIMTQFRRVLNDNSRRLFLYYAPFVFALCLIASLMINLPGGQVHLSFVETSGISVAQAGMVTSLLVSGGIFLSGLLLLLLLYQWPYKVTQQRNLLGLDNYITSKFSRVNQNFLVAKRRALNVERNKRMNQADELKEEAGIWTLAYNWFGMRLFLCEKLVRNKIYQIRRNTTLYNVGGVALCLVFALTAMMLTWLMASIGPSITLLIGSGVFSVVFVAVAYSMIMGKAMPEILNVLHANEWARFNQMSLHKTIADHVGEDKLQIVTFRDRNRFE